MMSSIKCVLLGIFLMVHPSDQLKDWVKDELEKTNKKLNEIEIKLKDISKEKCKNKNEHTLKPNQGSVYVRWGGNNCGNSKTSTELVYAGQAAGSKWTVPGAAVNYLCMPKIPIWSRYNNKTNPDAFVYGAEIHTHQTNVKGTPWESSKYNTKGVACAVCNTGDRTSVVMIPGRNRCFPGWTREYYGYLAAGHPTHAAGSEYVCLDEEPDIYATTKHVWNKMFYPVEAVCDGVLSCPPYVSSRELTCVVCSK